jgi:hypothetical protein
VAAEGAPQRLIGYFGPPEIGSGPRRPGAPAPA